MKCIILGATGSVGEHVLRSAVRRGHEVVVVARDKSRVVAEVPCEIAELDLRSVTPDELASVICGADAVVSALGSRTKTDHGVLAEAALTTVSAMRAANLQRYVGISAAPVATTPSPARPHPPKHDPGDDFMARYLMMPIVKRVFGAAYADAARMEDTIRASGLHWTLVRPPRLVDGAATGMYRTSVDANVSKGRRIGREDLAAYLLDVIDDASTIGHSIGIAY